MQVRIGILYSPKEIEIDLGERDGGDQLVAEITAALAQENGMLWLTDRRGRRIGVPADKVSYVEVGTDAAERRVGFSAL